MKAGTQERGTERGTEVKCGLRAIITCTVRAGRLYSLDSPKNLFFSVGQKLTILSCLHSPAFVSFLESVEVKGDVHI